MLSGIVTFALLFALIWVFERKRRKDLDEFSIATAVVVPIIIAALILIIGGLLGFYPWSAYVAWFAELVATFLVLWKFLEIPGIRSIMYTIAVLITKVVLAITIELLL